ncbi:MAG: DUF421 domain-containing protein [Propionibacteriaceae bacterium]|nr:DUF421 domain-containing protein [Propionibacteriaceae bacterium]
MFDALWTHLGISSVQALSVVISATVLFWFFTLIVSFVGQEARARVTITGFALMALIGAITARAILGDSANLAGGLIALVVLIVWEGVFRLLSRHLPGRWAATNKARVVMRDGVVDQSALRRAHLGMTDLMVRLRCAGITRLTDVAFAIVEADGGITVIRVGAPIDDALLAGINNRTPKPTSS